MSIPHWPEYELEVQEGGVTDTGTTWGKSIIRVRYPVDQKHKFSISEIEAGFAEISWAISYPSHDGPSGSSPGDVVPPGPAAEWIEAMGCSKDLSWMIEVGLSDVMCEEANAKAKQVEL